MFGQWREFRRTQGCGFWRTWRRDFRRRPKVGLLAEGISPWPRALEDPTCSMVMAAKLRVLELPRRAGRGPESGGVVLTVLTVCSAAWAEHGWVTAGRRAAELGLRFLLLWHRSLAGADRGQGLSEGWGCPCYLLSEVLSFTAQYKAWHTGSFQYVLVAWINLWVRRSGSHSRPLLSGCVDRE